jgi:hypothetical protein
MFSGLTHTLTNVTGVPLPEVPFDIPSPVNLELVDKDGHAQTPLGEAPLPLPPLNVSSLLSNLSLEGISNFIKNLSWDYVMQLIKRVATQAGELCSKAQGTESPAWSIKRFKWIMQTSNRIVFFLCS